MPCEEMESQAPSQVPMIERLILSGMYLLLESPRIPTKQLDDHASGVLLSIWISTNGFYHGSLSMQPVVLVWQSKGKTSLKNHCIFTNKVTHCAVAQYGQKTDSVLKTFESWTESLALRRLLRFLEDWRGEDLLHQSSSSCSCWTTLSLNTLRFIILPCSTLYQEGAEFNQWRSLCEPWGQEERSGCYSPTLSA